MHLHKELYIRSSLWLVSWTKKPVRGRANTFKYLVHDPERHPGEAARSSFQSPVDEDIVILDKNTTSMIEIISSLYGRHQESTTTILKRYILEVMCVMNIKFEALLQSLRSLFKSFFFLNYINTKNIFFIKLVITMHTMSLRGSRCSSSRKPLIMP